MKTESRIEATRKNLMSVPGYHFDEKILAEICANNEYITEGAFVMAQGTEEVYFENGSFVTRKDGAEIKRFALSTLSELQQEQLFCIWAGKQCSL